MNPSPSLQGALWNGNQQLATKKQLLSSISGLYTDIQDINLSTINVNTLGVSTFNGSFVSLSTLQFKAIDIGGLNFSFDLGLGDALGGALAGLGAAVGGAFVGLGTGVGLTVQGLTTGLASLVNGRSDNFINNSYFETVNGTTQLQISTLGDAFPLYSSITRSVSSVSANQVPGPEILLSTFFLPGTTCIRSVSDPLNIITGNSNIATSTIQSFGEWIPFVDPTVAGEDIYARKAQFSSLTLSNTNTTDYPLLMNMSNTNGLEQILSLIDTPNTQINVPAPFSPAVASGYASETILKNRTNFNYTMNYISTPFTQYQSTIGTYGTPVYFITSTITSTLTTIPKFTYTGADFGGANFAVCEPDETGFLSTGTMDLVAQSSNITFQWGLAVNNFNSTIAYGTSKRVSWNIPANTSNFIDIPQPQSTIQTFNLATVSLENHPYETRWKGQYTGPYVNGGMSFAQKPMAFGYNTSLQNIQGYDFQFNGNVFVDGILEADQLIALSTFTSTNIVTYFSTVQLDADNADIETAYISSLQTTFIGGDQISSFGIETYSQLSQFSYISTLVVDYQILEGTTGNTTANLNKIQATTAGAFVKGYTYGSFSNLSTTNLSTANLFANNPTFSTINLSSIMEIGLTSLINYPGVITSLTNAGTTAPVVGIGFKAQIYPNNTNQTRVDYNWDRMTGTSNGLNFYDLAVFTPTNPGSNLWTIGNTAIVNTSTLNVNTISTTSHSGDNITANTVTILSNLSFPNVQCNATPISLTLSNTNTSNTFTAFQTNIIQGATFPQNSNQFSIITTGSNTTIQDKSALIFNVTTGNTVTFGDNIDTVTLTSADVQARSVRYGTTAGGFLQPRAFTQTTSASFGAGQSINVNIEVTDSGSNTFPSANYNFLPAIQGFYTGNSAIAFNEVVIAPFSSNNNWWVNITAGVNAGAAGASATITWNNLLFPYDMMT